MDYIKIAKEEVETKYKRIDEALDRALDKRVAEMMATSHEYKKPNEDGALSMVTNYDWSKGKESIKNLQGLDKPINKEKVLAIANSIKGGEDLKPFIIVDKIYGIYPQSKGKKILLDGHHRLEACKMAGRDEVPVYYGKYSGQKINLEKKAIYKEEIYKEAAAIGSVGGKGVTPIKGMKDRSFQTITSKIKENRKKAFKDNMAQAMGVTGTAGGVNKIKEIKPIPKVAVEHAGFKATAKKISERHGLSHESASAILAASARRASASAIRKNPRLKKITGVK